MGSMSLIHWMLVLGVAALLFGAGRIPRVMGDVAKGIKAFKAGMKDDEPPVGEIPQKPTDHPAP